MNQHPSNKIFEEHLEKLSNSLFREKSVINRYKILTTYTQVMDSLVTAGNVLAGDLEAAMTYIKRYTPVHPVPKHYGLLTKLGLVVQESEELVKVISKDDNKVQFDIKNDPICSGSEALKLALVVLASEFDEVEYSVDYTMENREILFKEYVLVNKLDCTYEDYCGGVIEKKVGPLAEVEVRDADYNFVSVNVVTDCKTDDVFTVDQIEEFLDDIREKGVAFQCKVMGGKTVRAPGFNITKVDNVTRLFVPKRETVFAKGPEHDDLIEKILKFLRTFRPAVGRIHDYKPTVGKNKMQARNEGAAITLIDFTKDAASSEESQEEIRDLIGEDVMLMQKYVDTKEVFEENRELIQGQSHFRDYLTDFEGTTAWRKKVTEMRSTCGGKTFNQVLLGGTKALQEYLASPAYSQSLATACKQDYRGMDAKQCLDAFLDCFIRSPSQFPDMIISKGAYRFVGTNFSNVKGAAKFNPTKDPLQINIDHGVVGKWGDSEGADMEILRQRIMAMSVKAKNKEIIHKTRTPSEPEGSDNEEGI